MVPARFPLVARCGAPTILTNPNALVGRLLLLPLLLLRPMLLLRLMLRFRLSPCVRPAQDPPSRFRFLFSIKARLLARKC